MEADSQYIEQLLIEGISVGGLVVVVEGMMQRILPRATPIVRLFLTGVAIHFGCEYTGINTWYLTHSASAMKYYKDKGDEKYSSVISESKCQFMDMSQCQHSGFVEQEYGSTAEGFIRVLRK
jgi:hypothetical protein